MIQLLSAQQYDVAAGNLHMQYTSIYYMYTFYIQMRDFLAFSTPRQNIRKGPWNNAVYVFVLFAPAKALCLDMFPLDWTGVQILYV